MDLPGSDWGDFSCRRAVDSSQGCRGALKSIKRHYLHFGKNKALKRSYFSDFSCWGIKKVLFWKSKLLEQVLLWVYIPAKWLGDNIWYFIFSVFVYDLWCILCRSEPYPINFEDQCTPISCILILLLKPHSVNFHGIPMFNSSNNPFKYVNSWLSF